MSYLLWRSYIYRINKSWTIVWSSCGMLIILCIFFLVSPLKTFLNVLERESIFVSESTTCKRKGGQRIIENCSFCRKGDYNIDFLIVIFVIFFLWKQSQLSFTMNDGSTSPVPFSFRWQIISQEKVFKICFTFGNFNAFSCPVKSHSRLVWIRGSFSLHFPH